MKRWLNGMSFLVLMGILGGCLMEVPGDPHQTIEQASIRSDSGHFTQQVWADAVRLAFASDQESGSLDLHRGDDDVPYTCGALTCTCDDAVDCDEMHDHDVTSDTCSSSGDDGGETCCINESCE